MFEQSAKEIICSLCKCRISEWMITGGKTVTVRHHIILLRSDEIVHKSCYTDHRLSTGRDYGERIV